MYTLTKNEFAACISLVKCCLSRMGGTVPVDLDDDPYTWVDAKDLVKAGWTLPEARGAFGALIEKGIVESYDDDASMLTTQAYRWLDQFFLADGSLNQKFLDRLDACK